jgi:hypothetical protein
MNCVVERVTCMQIASNGTVMFFVYHLYHAGYQPSKARGEVSAPSIKWISPQIIAYHVCCNISPCSAHNVMIIVYILLPTSWHIIDIV